MKPAFKIDKAVTCDLKAAFLDNIQVFKEDSEIYHAWIRVGLKMRIGGFCFETFEKFSRLSD